MKYVHKLVKKIRALVFGRMIESQKELIGDLQESLEEYKYRHFQLRVELASLEHQLSELKATKKHTKKKKKTTATKKKAKG